MLNERRGGIGRRKTHGINMCVANGLIKVKDSDAEAKPEGYRGFRQEQQIHTSVLFAGKALMPCAEYLE